VWTAPVEQVDFDFSDAILVRIIHVSGLFARREGPLAMMVSVDRVLDQSAALGLRHESVRFVQSPA
jgi:hypothetical protein